jgi:hypothetical protein
LKEVPKAERLIGRWQAVAWPRNFSGPGFVIFNSRTIIFDELPVWVFRSISEPNGEGDLEVTLQMPENRRRYKGTYQWKLQSEALRLSWYEGRKHASYDARWDGRRVWLHRTTSDGETETWILVPFR